MNKGVGLSLGGICVVAIATIFILTSTGIILHGGTLYKPAPDLRSPLILTNCGDTVCDTTCIGDNDALVGMYIKDRCYTGLFTQE